jgi:hypothetical protein
MVLEENGVLDTYRGMSEGLLKTTDITIYPELFVLFLEYLSRKMYEGVNATGRYLYILLLCSFHRPTFDLMQKHLEYKFDTFPKEVLLHVQEKEGRNMSQYTINTAIFIAFIRENFILPQVSHFPHETAQLLKQLDDLHDVLDPNGISRSIRWDSSEGEPEECHSTPRILH